MDWKNYQTYLLHNLKNAKPASGGKFINCRCTECFDSMNQKSAHMYISIPWNGGEYSWYYCHKCNSSGFIDHNKLIEWGIYNKDIALDLNEYNKSIKGRSNNRKFNRDIYQVRNTSIRTDDKTLYKQKYINDRLGTNLSLKEMIDLKIVLNLKDLLIENNVRDLTRDINIVNDLDREFIGFLSVDNAFLNMRRTVGEGLVYKAIDKRYVNYRIFEKEDTSRRFYTIPTQVLLDNPERIKIHISEGPMDILSIYLNVRQKESGIYTCVAGCNYVSVIRFFLEELRLPWVELHIYSDNDRYGTMDAILKSLRRLPDTTIPAYLHKNLYTGEKDFGVPMNRIKESIIPITY